MSKLKPVDPARASSPRRRAVSRRALLGGLAVLALARPAVAASSDGDPATALVGLMHERLELMVEVARSKWNSGTPVEDIARERSLFESVAALAPGFRLDPDLATTFFRAQIEAAKLVESAWIARWAAAYAGVFDDAPDQRKVLRPKIDRLTPELLKALAALVPGLKRADADRIIAASRMPDEIMSLAMTRALQPVIELCGVRAGAR